MTWVDFTGGATPPAHPAPRSDVPRDGMFERALAYVAQMDPAISGQGGHNATWAVARKCAADFQLTEAQTLEVLRIYNQRCEPPWSDKELAHKAQDAAGKARVSVPVEDRERHWATPRGQYAPGNGHAEPDYDDEYRRQAESDGEVPADPEAEQSEQAAPKKSPTTPADVIRRWREEGMLPRVPTGIATLDRLCGGGLLIPRRVVLVGAPSAGKTYLESTIANLFGTMLGAAGFDVGMLAVDEDDSDLTVRLAQMAGYLQAQCEERDPETLDSIESALSDRRIRFYDNSWTIEEAAADVAAWAKADGRFGALCVDSLHSVRSARSDAAETSRAMVEGNVAALRWAYDVHRLTIIATAEMNRMGYATVKSASEANPLALSAESRATEYFAQVLLSLQTVKDSINMVHVQVAKNRGARRGEFWLELDHASHGLHEVPDPDASPEAQADKEQKTQAANRAQVLTDAKTLARIVRENPGTNDADLRTAVAKAGIRWGTSRFEIAKSQLQDGAHGVHLVDRSGSASGSRNPRQWFVEPIEEDSRS